MKLITYILRRIGYIRSGDLSKDTLLFAKEQRRMCNSCGCRKCGLEKYACTLGNPGTTEEDDRYIIEVVQKWSDHHSKVSYKEDYLKKFPDAPLREVTPTACRKEIYGGACLDESKNCPACWNEFMT